MNVPIESIDVPAVAAVVLAWLGRALVFGTVLAALTLLLTRLLRHRCHPRFEGALWSIVLLKFLIPIGPEWSFSMASVGEALMQRSPAVLGVADTAFMDPTQITIAADEAAGQSGVTATGQAWTWAVLVAAVYLACATGLLIVRLRSYQALVARCRTLPPADEPTRSLVVGVCRKLGVKRIPSVRISEEVPAPFVMGIFRPLLVLSHRQLVRPDELETVVVHEVTHLRRGDLYVRYLQWTAGTVLFFWPVVSWVNRRIDAALEHACDEWALRYGRLTAGEYARCLLRAIRPTRSHRFAYQPAYMAAHPAMLERRIEMIMQSPNRPSRRRIWGLSTVAFLLAWGGFVLTGASSAGDFAGKEGKTWSPTKEDVKLHTMEVIDVLNAYPSVDVDGDGEVSRPERTAFVVAAVMQFPDEVLEAYPYADYDGDGQLALVEIYDLVRGNTLSKMVKMKAKEAEAEEGAGGPEWQKEQKAKQFLVQIETQHAHLDMIEWMLAEMPAEPTADQVAEAKAQIDPIEETRFKKDSEKKLVELEQKAAHLRAKAAEIGGEEGAELEAKAAQLEQKIQGVKSKKDG